MAIHKRKLSDNYQRFEFHDKLQSLSQRFVLVLKFIIVLWVGLFILSSQIRSGTAWGISRMIGYPTTKVPQQLLTNISYDHRAILINGQRQLLLTGAIHYPRSTPGIWPELFRKSKEAGINTIDTYVFWNIHEPIEGEYDFHTDYANLPLFLELAHQHGLYVVLRIGPYVCAEWTLGGVPAWLLNKPGIVFRTWNNPFMEHMEKFVRKVVKVVDPFLASKGGPIIMMQMENEYGNVEWEYGSAGHRYILWAADLANSLNTGVPWIMCQQSNVDTVILTCNGFYCDNWINSFWRNNPKKPPMFTELWTGWFQHWKTPKPVRPSTDLAFSAARWVAKGGSMVAYYMWHGGTNFARWGSDFKTTSYDYDAPINEYGFESYPKYSHLKRLHLILEHYSNIILNNEPVYKSLGSKQEAHTYGNPDTGISISFISNFDDNSPALVFLFGNNYRISKWTVIILVKDINDDFEQIYSTSSILNDLPNSSSLPSTASLRQHVNVENITWIIEPRGIWDQSIAFVNNCPLEQIRFTNDSTDYLWYSYNDLSFGLNFDDDLLISIEPATDIIYVYIGDMLMHPREVTAINVDMNQNGKVKITKKNIINIAAYDLKLAAIKSSSMTLNILSSTMGLVNYGAHYENVKKGLYGTVKLNERDITKGKWIHQVGLYGESKRYYERRQEIPWISHGSLPLQSSLIWYRINLNIKELKEKYLESMKYCTFALYLATMGKGQAWVNGHAIGRYWDVPSTGSECKACNWAGGFHGEKCFTECNTETQKYYHVPFDWIIPNDNDTEIVLFEERGGDPTGIQLLLLC